MKKLLPIIALALASTSPGLLAQEDVVTSVNAVGMVRVDLQRGTLTLLGFPFNSDSEVVQIEELFGGLPNGTNLFIWSNQQWDAISKGRGVWGQETIELPRGASLFVQIPESSPDEVYEVVISGEVPDSLSNETTTTLTELGLTLVSFPYPVSVNITEAGFSPEPGDTVFVWSDGWISETFSRGSWVPGTTIINPGEGIFYKSASTKNWDSTKPYLWP